MTLICRWSWWTASQKRTPGRVHVFLWTPLADEEEGKSNFIQVYKPAANDEWEEAGICWVEVERVRQAAAISDQPPVHCNPDDLWLK